MYPTRLLRRVVHYLWECHREPGEMRIRLEHPNRDQLHVEEAVETSQVFVRYFAKGTTGELVKQTEVVCYIAQHGEWLPMERYLANGGTTIYAVGLVKGESVKLFPMDNQHEGAGFCDAWALRLLEEGWLAIAAKLKPLAARLPARPQWPEPTTPAPDLETIEEWMWEDGGCEATDACWVEPDGVCSHGHPSWLLRLGLV